jgi:hypothetical protein
MRYYRKVITICAEDSPNVKYGLLQRQMGIEPTNEILISGVLTYDDYVKRRATWDEVRQCVGLDAKFYKGKQQYLFPSYWLNRAAEVARKLAPRRHGVAIGCDPAEGGDSTCWSVIDGDGLIVLISDKTPDTNVIANRTMALMHEYSVPAGKVCFDRGGGGKQIADNMRAKGFNVRTVGFGESVGPDPRRYLAPIVERIDIKEERYTYKNRRAEMYGTLSEMLDPINTGWGIPHQYTELVRQLSLIPLKYDEEGRMWLPPKQNKSPDSTGETLTQIIGHSPDEADSLVVAVFAMVSKASRPTAGAI